MLSNAKSSSEVEFWGRYIFGGPVGIAYFFLYFSFVFPWGDISKKLNSLLLVPTMLMLLLVPSSLILKKGILTKEGPIPFWGIGLLFFSVFFLSFFLWGVRNFVLKYKKARGDEKEQIRCVFLGLFITLLFGIAFNLIFPALHIGFEKHPNIGPSFSLIFIAFAAYAITKHRLMDISVVINRTAAEVLTIIFLTTGYFGLVWIDRSFISKGFDGWFFGLTILYGIFVGNVHKDLRLFLQTTSTKLFLRGRYNYFKEMSKITSQISRCLSRENILKTLNYVFYDLMEAKSAKVYLSEEFDKPEAKKLLLLERPTFKDDMLIVPCRYEGKPNAFILLGPKLSEDAYSGEDLRLLKNLSEQTAAALDHCRLCEEMLAAQKQLLLADKLSALGRVAAGLAHEIKNPLTAIKGMTQGLGRNLNDPETQADFMAVVPKEIDRLTSLVENLSNLGKTPKFQLTKVNVNLLLENNLKLFESRCRKQGINIVNDLGTLPEIEADGERLTQVFTNLILNAIQAMPEGGTLELKTQSVKLKSNENIMIEISDAGQGIPEDRLKNIFEPFFTTKEEGTGLGLAITRKIIEDHSGEIKVESAVGKGTSFKIMLPVEGLALRQSPNL